IAQQHGVLEERGVLGHVEERLLDRVQVLLVGDVPARLLHEREDAQRGVLQEAEIEGGLIAAGRRQRQDVLGLRLGRLGRGRRRHGRWLHLGGLGGGQRDRVVGLLLLLRRGGRERDHQSQREQSPHVDRPSL